MTRPPVSNDRPNPARAINRVSKLVTKFFDRKLVAAGVNVAYLSVLGPLAEKQKLSQKELAVLSGSSQAAIAELLARMVKDGLLSRSQDDRDRRQVLFSLTPSGTALLPSIQSIIEKGNVEIFADLGSNGIDELLMRLKQIEERLQGL